MKTPLEQGKIDGLWTPEQIKQCGFKSAQDCLKHQEKVHQEEVAKLPRLQKTNPAYAKRHAEYLEGLIFATRQSLK